ncbi:MAG TPA: hypothetical protein VD886_19550, partial [Herpetosiphonaceae bacterium]|nr:hypothetical protein [Herpetosiphonaceae bacterium]
NVAGGFPEPGEYNQLGDVIIYIDSQDLESDLARIEALGGTVLLRPTEVPGSGWMAMFSDPGGSRLALWKSASQG